MTPGPEKSVHDVASVNCPMGSRLMLVASIPNQAAHPMGCKLMGAPASPGKKDSAARRKIKGSPNSNVPWEGSAGEKGVDSCSPTMRDGMIKIKPARGPAIPTSKSWRRSGKRDRILITAPKVPKGLNGGGAGIK